MRVAREWTNLDGMNAILEQPAPVLRNHRAAPALVLVESEPVRILIADAQPVVRAGLEAMLDRAPDMRVSGVARDVLEAVALAAELRPDVALLDAHLPALGGLEAARRIQDDPALRHVRVLLLTADEDGEDLFAALGAGALGFLPKSSEPAELVRAVRTVADGGAALSPSATRRLIAAFHSGAKSFA